MCYKLPLEPITHFLTGAVLARAGFNRKTALATATMTLAAEAPDLDVFWSFKGPVVGFAHHRGFTHSFLGLIFVSALVTGFMYLVWRVRGWSTKIPNLPPRWGMLFMFAYVAGLSHILLDYTNNYGVRPFWPLWDRLPSRQDPPRPPLPHRRRRTLRLLQRCRRWLVIRLSPLKSCVRRR